MVDEGEMEKNQYQGLIHRNKNHRESFDEYIKVIYLISEKNPERWIRNKEIANRLDVKPSSVTNMINKLKKNDLIRWKPRVGIKLTEKGKKRAEEIIINKNILILFLEKVLNLNNEEEIEQISCNMEHYFTKTLKEKMLHLLGVKSKTIKKRIKEEGIIEIDDFHINKIYTQKELSDLILNINMMLKKETTGDVMEYLDSMIKKLN